VQRQKFNFNRSHHCYYTHHLRRQWWTFFLLFFCIHIFQLHNFPTPLNYWFVTTAQAGGRSYDPYYMRVTFWSYKWFYEFFFNTHHYFIHLYRTNIEYTRTIVCGCVDGWTVGRMYVLCKSLLKYLSTLKQSDNINRLVSEK